MAMDGIGTGGATVPSNLTDATEHGGATSVRRPPEGAPRRPRAGAFLWAHRWFVLVALTLAAAGLWQAARVLLGPAVVIDTVARGDLVQSVVASGHVETPYRVEIGAQITGIVTDVAVEEGDTVKRDQVLISLDGRELKAAVVQAEGAVAQAEARIRQLDELTVPAAREALAQAKATATAAQQTFDRATELAKSGYTTQATLDDARKTLDVARAQVRAAELQVFTASPGGSDHVLAETQVNQAHATLESARSRLGYATVTAPRDGVIITRSVERGAVVQPGKALMVLAPSGETQVVLQVDERNLGQIALGQPALVSADAYPDQSFAAKVSYINPSVDISRASVEIKLLVASPPAFLKQDMSVSVDIEVARRNDTLVAPARAVRDALSGRPWVMTVADGRAHKVPVKTGIRGAGRIEILDGVKAGDQLIPATSSLKPGERVRPVSP